MELAQAELDAEALWADLRSRLDRVADSMDPHADVAAAAGLFDLLSNAERAALARYMYDEIRVALRDTAPITPLQHSILGLVDPYITNSDLESEARILLSNALANDRRSFEDEFAIAHGLIDLSFRVPGSDDLWTDFYARHASELATRYDAFDLALAGLAPWNLGRFADLIAAQPAEGWLIDRIDMFLPTLTRNFTPAQVSALVQSVYDRCFTSTAQERLSLLSEAYGLSVAEEVLVTSVHILPSPTTPEPLRLARMLVESQQRSDPEGTRLALDRPQIHVYRSGYTGETAIDRFQNAALEKIRELAGHGNQVPSSESVGFAELYSPISLGRKVVFAFPTYLTGAKRNLGYSCASFGLQRRIGILFPQGNRLTDKRDRPTTLEDLLREVKEDDGTVYCLRNYAISEIVRQVAEKDGQLEQYFDERHLCVCESRNYVPVIPDPLSRNFVFLFDLSGATALNRRRRELTSARRSKSKNNGRNAWMNGAKLGILSHAASIEVGILFSKYMVEWLVEDGRWDEIEAFVSASTTRSDFRRALSALGIDVEPAPPPVNLTNTKPRKLRAVNE